MLLFCLLIIFLFPFPQSADASLADDVAIFKQKYQDIYNSIDPALADKMEIFLQDVVDYVVINYDVEKDINVQIKNGVASVLLTGDKYKNDLLPFLLEQAENKELYQSQLNEMKEIVRKNVELCVNPQDPSSDNPSQLDGRISTFIETDTNGIHYEYDYLSLRSDYIKYQMGQRALLYNDFISTNKSTIALKDSVGRYIIYAKMRSAYIDAQIKGIPFDAEAYVKKSAEAYTMPKSVTKVSIVSGMVTYVIVTQE